MHSHLTNLHQIARRTGLDVHQQEVKTEYHVGLCGPMRGTLWVVPRETDGTFRVSPRGQQWETPVRQYLEQAIGHPEDMSKGSSGAPRWRTDDWSVVLRAAEIMAETQGVGKCSITT